MKVLSINEGFTLNVKISADDNNSFQILYNYLNRNEFSFNYSTVISDNYHHFDIYIDSFYNASLIENIVIKNQNLYNLSK